MHEPKPANNCLKLNVIYHDFGRKEHTILVLHMANIHVCIVKHV